MSPPPLTLAPGAVRARVLTAAERPAAAATWRALEDELGRPELPATWDWTETWLEHFAPVVGHRFVVGERDGRPVGIALLTAERHPAWSPRPRALHVGTAGEPRGHSAVVERNRLLVAPGDRGAFARELVAVAHRDARWDRLALDAFVPEEAAELLAAEPRLVAREAGCPVAELGSGPGDVLAVLGKSSRARVRRTLRAFGPLAGEWAADTAQADAFLTELAALHQARWEADDEPGVFASARFTAFHRALVARLLPRDEVALFRVRRDDGTLGCVYGFLTGGRFLFYQGGFRRFADNKLRAGLAVHALCMQACRDRGVAEYDFLAPVTRYKEELATRVDPLVWAEYDRPRVRPRVWNGLKAARDAVAARRG